jgi:hypothetical protein
MATLQRQIPAPWVKWRLNAPLLLRGKLFGNLLFLAAVTVLAIFVFFAIFPQAVAPFDPTANSLSARHESPGFVGFQGIVHIMGSPELSVVQS